MGSFLPLFCSSPAERNNNKKKLIFIILCWTVLHDIHYACIRYLCARQCICKNADVISKERSHFGGVFLWFSSGSQPQKLEQVALVQHVAQGHKAGHMAVGGNSGSCGEQACSCQEGHASPGYYRPARRMIFEGAFNGQHEGKILVWSILQFIQGNFLS